MKEIYLDNSATTPLGESVAQKMQAAMAVWGNPSSLHTKGNEAHALMEEARRQVGESLGLRRLEAGELVFTSGGSEADNLAVLGCAFAKPRRRGGRIITTDSEHSAVENCMRYLESNGFEVVRIPTKGGVLDLDRLEAALNHRTFLVSLMMVNNETGALYDIAQAFAMAKRFSPDIVTHTDAVQGYLKCRFSLKNLQADLVSLSAHKIHGPKGAGALYLSSDARRRRDLEPRMWGGGQEFGLRSGTENVIGIVGFGEAARVGFANQASDMERLTMLRSVALERLSDLPLVWNTPVGAAAPHILNVQLPNIRSETMLHELSRSGIFVSNGAACSSHNASPSSALLSFGLTSAQAASSIRISFSPANTLDDISALHDALSAAIDKLVRMKR